MNWLHCFLHAMAIVLIYILAVDPLTGLWVRRCYQLYYRLTYKRNKSRVIFIDLDNLKKVNDTCGHHYGDKVLRQVGYTIRRISRFRAFRWGGDEFCVFLARCSDKKAYAMAERIRREIERLPIPITMTAVVAKRESDAIGMMSKVKGRGKNQVYHA